MSFTLGPEIVDAELKIAQPKAKPVDMARSQVKAIRTLGCTVIGLVTPYIDAFHNNNINMLESGGDVTVASSVNLGLVKDEWTSMVDQQVSSRAQECSSGRASSKPRPCHVPPPSCVLPIQPPSNHILDRSLPLLTRGRPLPTR